MARPKIVDASYSQGRGCPIIGAPKTVEAWAEWKHKVKQENDKQTTTGVD
jgi:hypothetical protein